MYMLYDLTSAESNIFIYINCSLVFFKSHAEIVLLSSHSDMRSMHNHVMYLWILCALGMNGWIVIDCQVDCIITHTALTAEESFQ